ncbi:GNAT family N-acetyltransferase [Mycobacterium sp. 3519A]|jgi:predicted GNAT family acetyltransferase|uniref:GNAT family N-acetyltransferase n=1 Tax=Mycobacterium sp. 3519A TaxID=2057184 RepID=UPI000C797F34|nr:GNAT family N-acetyltransferase [Mycobacterium sp. 3519A]
MQITDNQAKSCYEGVIDDQVVGVVVYKRIRGRVVIRHTVIESEFRGKGLGAQLVRSVLDDLRQRGDKISNYCGFVADFIAENPEYHDLVDADRPGVTAPRELRGQEGVAPAPFQ